MKQLLMRMISDVTCKIVLVTVAWQTFWPTCTVSKNEKRVFPFAIYSKFILVISNVYYFISCCDITFNCMWADYACEWSISKIHAQ